MRLYPAALLGLTAWRLALAATLPLSPDEAYYFLWSRGLQAGYFDHPPMVALWIRLGTALAGDGPLGIRLLGPLSALAGSLCLWRAAEDFFPRRRAGIAAAALFNATLMMNVGAVIMTPDTPLVFFWTVTLAALARLLATGRQAWWLAIGAAAGAALLAKYTGLLLIGGIGLWLLTSARQQLRSPWPWAGLALAVLVFAPDLYWNATHGWVSFLKQGSRVASFDPARAAQFFAELLFGQLGLITPVIAVLAAAGVWHLRWREPRGALLLWLTLLPLAVFVQHTISSRVQANWPAVLLPAAFIAAGALPAPVLARWLKPALATGLALSLAVQVQAAAALFPLPPRLDPTALQLQGWGGLTQALKQRNVTILSADDYATLAELAYLLPPEVVIVGLESRWQYFDMKSDNALAGQNAIRLTRRQDAACPNPLGTLTRQRGAAPIISYRLCGFTVPPGGVLLPRPLSQP